MAGFGEVLSAHARHVGVNDLLPGVPGIRGGSPHAANARGMMDQTAAAGPRFASFGGLVNGIVTLTEFGSIAGVGSALRSSAVTLLFGMVSDALSVQGDSGAIVVGKRRPRHDESPGNLVTCAVPECDRR